MGFSRLILPKIGEVGLIGNVFDSTFVLQMDNPQRIKNLLVVPSEVRRWLALLSSSEIHQVASHLGPIGNFKDIESDGYLVEALVQL